MTTPWERLAEARIRDWQRRRDAGEAPPAPPTTAGDALEGQLLHEIHGLIDQARTAAPHDRAALEQKSRDLEVRLMVLLEGQGLPLAAQRIAADLQRQRAENAGPSR